MPKSSKWRSSVVSTASLSLRALACTKPSRRSLIRPTSCPRAIDCENAWISCPATSLAITPASGRAARRLYSGSSAVSSAAVRFDSSSSSRVLAPSYSPEIVRVATRIGSTACRPSAQRCTARTILLRSTGSLPPLRLLTRIAVAVGGGVGRKDASSCAGSVATAVSFWFMVVLFDGAPCRLSRGGGEGRDHAGRIERHRATSPSLAVATPGRCSGGRSHRRVLERCRNDRDRRAGRGRDCVTSHLPPEIPRPAPRGVHARGCRQVFGLVDTGLDCSYGIQPHLLAVASRDRTHPSAV